MSQIFKLPRQNMKFHLFKFNNIFSGLIDLVNLKHLKAKQNFENGYLLTLTAKIKLHYQVIKNQINSITGQPRCEQVLSTGALLSRGNFITSDVVTLMFFRLFLLIFFRSTILLLQVLTE